MYFICSVYTLIIFITYIESLRLLPCASLKGRDVVILVRDGGDKAGLSIDVVAHNLEAPIGKPHPFDSGVSVVFNTRIPKRST